MKEKKDADKAPKSSDKKRDKKAGAKDAKVLDKKVEEPVVVVSKKAEKVAKVQPIEVEAAPVVV